MGQSGNQPSLAHVRQDPVTGNWMEQSVEAHAIGTARNAAEFARAFGGEEIARLAALWHDLGKMSPEFQARIRTVSGYDPDAHLEGSSGKVDHSTAGAIHAASNLGPMGRILAYLIAGHHAGLPDWHHEIGVGGELSKRLDQIELLSRATQAGIPKAMQGGGQAIVQPLLVGGHPIENVAYIHLWIRMLFSCLVDADFLDTEAFMNPDKASERSTEKGALPALKERFDTYMSIKQSKAPETPVNRIRRQVLDACRSGGKLEPGLFSLTVPTGGGKTLASMAFALEHALARGKRRIVVVIPYTSIIEQTAAELRKVFGDDAVLEHHSNLDPEKETFQSRLASENWDMPIIVTTNVQFFESLFAARTSACRKLHNLAGSVVIFDEAQMLPPSYLAPILGVLQGLVRHFGVTALLCTATQPSLEGRIGSQKAAFAGLEGVRELMGDPAELAQRLKRVRLRAQHPDLAPTTWKDLAQEIMEHEQMLCIVNTRRDCRELHALMPEGTIHLSALMCAEHRSRVIKRIKELLAERSPVRVISTQLVEAGVDLDFPVVFRALAGLDSMAQAAGRCNREGRLNDTGRLGEVVLFAPPKPAPPGLLRKGEDAGREMLRCHPESVANLTPDGFRRYFELFFAKVISFDEKDMKGLLETSAPAGQIQFRTAASRFKLIDDQAQCSLVVWYGEHKPAIQRLLEEIRFKGPSRDQMRKLQRFTVNLPERDFLELHKRGEIQETCGIWAQAVDGLYDERLGLCPQGGPWNPETYVL